MYIFIFHLRLYVSFFLFIFAKWFTIYTHKLSTTYVFIYIHIYIYRRRRYLCHHYVFIEKTRNISTCKNEGLYIHMHVYININTVFLYGDIFLFIFAKWFTICTHILSTTYVFIYIYINMLSMFMKFMSSSCI